MALKNIPLLTIAIPTYNRSGFLDRCLGSLVKEIKKSAFDIELIVSDNASTDGTRQVVEKYITAGNEITYSCNKENLGFDGNFSNCYQLATGKYVWLLSDDDLVIEGALEKIVLVLSKGEYGVLNLAAMPLTDQLDCINGDLSYLEFQDSISFIQKVGLGLTFISSNIVARKYYSEIDINKYYGTSLLHVPVLLSASFKCAVNAMITKGVIAVQQDNSGGYDVFEVFVENLSKILDDFVSEHPGVSADSIRKLIQDKLIISFIPYWYFKLVSHQGAYKVSNNQERFKKYLSDNFLYYIFIVPLFKLPKKIYYYYNLAAKGIYRSGHFISNAGSNKFIKKTV